MTRHSLVIASYLEPELVERVRAVDGSLDVFYDPDLLPAPRYAADHVGGELRRSDAEERRWRRALAGAEILFDFDRTNADALPELAPSVRWIQATSAGIGRYVLEHGYTERMPDTVFTTASGVHAIPLAEFCALAMTAFSRGLFTMLEQQRERRWTRFARTDLEGRTVVIFGHGSIGVRVARVARGLGMKTVGIKRSIEGESAEALGVDEVLAAPDLASALPRADVLVLAAPHTPDTEGAIGTAEIDLLPPGAVLINIGRGPLVDEDALVEALRSGRLAGAALDVFRSEPLPPESPLWELPNVLVSPHSAANTDRENGRIANLFRDNLRRYLAGEPLRNVLDPERLY